MGTAIKHPVKPVICNFLTSGYSDATLSPERQSARMSKITIDAV